MLVGIKIEILLQFFLILITHDKKTISIEISFSYITYLSHLQRGISKSSCKKNNARGKLSKYLSYLDFCIEWKIGVRDWILFKNINHFSIMYPDIIAEIRKIKFNVKPGWKTEDIIVALGVCLRGYCVKIYYLWGTHQCCSRFNCCRPETITANNS